MTTHDVVGEHLEAGREAAARYAWREAREALSAVEASVGLSPGDLERLAEAAWWTGGLEECIAARERAYEGYVAAGNSRRAAYVALELVTDYRRKLATSISAGWLKRAVRLFQDAPEGPEHGHLALAQAVAAWRSGKIDDALEDDRRALEMGSRFGDRDLMARALLDQGSNLIAKGQVAEGMADVEEACAAAVGGELSPYTTSLVFCGMITTCRDLADFARAGEWAEAAKRWCERQAIAGFPGVCRVYRAEVMRLRGAMADAEREARMAYEELKDFNPSAAGEAFQELGEIRLRMGDLPTAEEAFRQARELGTEAQPGLPMLQLAQGRPDVALATIRTALEDTWDRLERARLLPAQTEIAVAAGDIDAAIQAADELETIATAYGTSALRAAAAQARGVASLASGDPKEAGRQLRRSAQLWQEVNAPYETGRARLLLGEVLLSAGEAAAAAVELQTARSAFERLGAALDARRATELMDRAAPRSTGAARAKRTFMFTDIVGSTTLIEAIGDEAWEDLRRWHDGSLRTCFAEHEGDEIDHAGDGFFIAFPHARSAIECAMEIQRKLAEHRRTHGFAPQIRIGLHATEATRSGGRYLGKGIHAAARIGALARGGEIVASAETVAGVDGFAASQSREVTLKGISEPVEVVAIDWR